MQKVVIHIKRFAVFSIVSLLLYALLYISMFYIGGCSDETSHKYARIAATLIFLGLFMFYKWPGGLSLFNNVDISEKK